MRNKTGYISSKKNDKEGRKVLMEINIDLVTAPETRKKLKGREYVDKHNVIQWSKQVSYTLYI